VTISRRRVLRTTCVGRFVARTQTRPDQLMKRDLGRVNFEATSLALGGVNSARLTEQCVAGGYCGCSIRVR
jgi:hypothetical protein